ncbi:MAG: hypothetical protein D3906_12090, partial [Candidatus Electrothrix sp. AUS1_2]|nr:hypothetical protein [Candidatus Electrothrix sp. AUS1_2]
KGSKNKKVFLVVALIAICYASVDAYFHRYLIMSDFYYAQGEWKKSGEVAEKGFNSLKGKSEFYDFVYGRYSLYRKIKRAEEKTKAPERNVPAVHQEVTATQEDAVQEESAVNAEMSTEQEGIEQEDSGGSEEINAEQEAVDQDDSVRNEEIDTEQEAVDQEESVGAEQDEVEQEDSALNEAAAPKEGAAAGE